MQFLKKLFSKDRQKSDLAITPQDVEKIVQAYGSILQTQAPSPGCVADESKLPFPKQKIKEALIITLKLTPDTQMKEMLKVAYVQLADWQNGVGEIDQGLDLTKMDMNTDPKILAQQVVAQGEGYEKWKPMVEAEQEKLIQELQILGLWGG